MNVKKIRHLPPQSCLLFHRWQKVKTAGPNTYYECHKCGARKATQHQDGGRPVDFHWVLNGEWTRTEELPSSEQLLANAFRNLKNPQDKAQPRWLVVSNLFAVGQGTANQLCARYDLDPDQLLAPVSHSE